MKIAFFSSGEAFKKIYWKDSSIIFFDEMGWWVAADGVRENIRPDVLSEKIKVDPNANYVEILKKFRLWGATFERWCGKGDHYELLFREALILTLRIRDGLRQFNVKYCVMHTSVSHHVDSIIFQTACELAEVKLIFLYHEILGSRLLPLKQAVGLNTRFPLFTEVSKYEYHEIIEEFIDNKKKRKPPKNNISVTGVGRSFGCSLIYLIYLDFRYLKNNFLELLSIKCDHNIFSKFSNRYSFQLTEQAFRQKRALSYLSRSIKKECYFKSRYEVANSIVLIIAAHNQPEATSYTEGGDWGNHIDIALEIYRLGYKGVLAYKEHKAISLYLEGKAPTRVGMARSIDYYEALKAVGCEFVDYDMNLSVDPLENYWYLPITITGTIAIERSLAGFHTIVTGQPWYKGLPGVLHISEIDSLETINPDWVLPNKKLAQAAYDFMTKLLNNKTLTNLPGIGSGVPFLGRGGIKDFTAEMDKLLRVLVN